MLYSTHIFIGKEFDTVLTSIATSLYRFDRDTIGYNAIYRVDAGKQGKMSFARLKMVPAEDTTLRLTGSDVVVTWSSEKVVTSSELAKYYRDTIFSDRIQAGVNADSLHVFLHFPFYKENPIKVMQELCEAIKSTSLPTQIDFIGYCEDLVSFIEPRHKVDVPSTRVVQAFVKMRETVGLNMAGSHLLAIENKNVEGFPLIVQHSDNTTPEEKKLIEVKAAVSFSEMMAQLLYLLCVYYERVFPLTAEQNDVTGIGFSTLYFDKYIFANYLLQRAMLHAMDEEAVNQNDVDVNKSISVVNELLKNKETILTDFYNKYKGKENDARYDDLKEELEGILERVKELFDQMKNMPDKVAILAVLLSKSECELFSSSVFDINSRCYNDLYSESIDYFIEEDKAKHYHRSENELVVNPLKELKEINRKAINSEAHIRELEKSITELEKQIELNDKVQDCFVDDNGYYNFGNNKFRLLQNIDEEPLAETYEPKENTLPSVDLHTHFSTIKNQGQQGSCLSFTLTSIFEYMLRVSNAEDCDLSEAFLYYNARNLDENSDVDVTIDKGSRFHPAIDSLRKFGIALEKFCPYNDGVYNQRPSDAAYADAEKRKLLKALSVNINVTDFKSALAEGYPIAASFSLYESFEQARTNGYVPIPTTDEMAKSNNNENDDEQNRHARHAMVVCGYSDELQMFLVRNSWGNDWGDNGYCYVPYGYVEQAGLVNFACIITEVASIDKISPELRQIPAMKIDNADLHIRYYINIAALQKEQSEISQYKLKRIQCLEYFEQLKARYANANERDSFIDKNVELLETEKAELHKTRENAQLRQEKIKADYRKTVTWRVIGLAVFVVACVLIFWGVNTILREFVYEIVENVSHAISNTSDINQENNETDKEYFYLNYLWLIPICLTYFVVLLIKSRTLWKAWREERDELDAVINDCNKRTTDIAHHVRLFRHKTFVAWQIIKSLNDVQLKVETLYSNYLSLLNNLRTWYAMMKEANEEVCIESSFPNMTILDKELLDSYFENELSHTAVCDVPLTENIEQHEVTGEYLSNYRNNLQTQIFERLLASLREADFDISAHVAQDRFSNMAKVLNREHFGRLNRQSDIFIQIDTSRRGLVDKIVLLLAPSVDRYGNELEVKMRPIAAQKIESDDRFRMMLIKTATYFFDECVALRPVKAKK